MTGLELVQRLREQSFRGNHGALGMPENRALYEALAVNVMMSKPFDVHQLRAPITRLANGVARVSEQSNSIQFSPAELRNPPKSALESNDAIEKVAPEGVGILPQFISIY